MRVNLLRSLSRIRAGLTVKLPNEAESRRIWVESITSTSYPERVTVDVQRNLLTGHRTALLRTTNGEGLDPRIRLHFLSKKRNSSFLEVARNGRSLSFMNMLTAVTTDYARFLKSLAHRQGILLLNYDFHSLKGHYSIAHAVVDGTAARGLDCHLLLGSHLERLPGASMLAKRFLSSTRLIVNGLHCFEYESTWQLVRSQRRKPLIYLHEGPTQFSRFFAANPRYHDELKALLRNSRVIVVSQAQKEKLEQTLDIHAHHVVPAPAPYAFHPWVAELSAITDKTPPTRRRRVSMIGTVQPRKGPEFFDAVAAILPDIDFVWLGPGENRVFSQARHIGCGPPLTALRLLATSDVLLLSSLDDPNPLSAVEALAVGCRVVCGTWTGTASLVGDVRGCATFQSFRPQAAAAAILTALAEPLDRVSAMKMIEAHEPTLALRRLVALVDQ